MQMYFQCLINFKKAKRDEYEIADIINIYIKKEKCSILKIESPANYWLDTGSVDRIISASNFIRELSKAGNIDLQTLNSDNKLMKNIVVIGFGHIGSVISGVLANNGYFVVGIEKNINLIENFKNNNSPISEPNLQNIINTALSKNNLLITNKLDYIKSADVIIITVGTPLDEQLNADLTSISDCCKEIEPFLKNGQLILIKSTIPPGTTKKSYQQNSK